MNSEKRSAIIVLILLVLLLVVIITSILTFVIIALNISFKTVYIWAVVITLITGIVVR